MPSHAAKIYTSDFLKSCFAESHQLVFLTKGSSPLYTVHYTNGEVDEQASGPTENARELKRSCLLKKCYNNTYRCSTACVAFTRMLNSL